MRISGHRTVCRVLATACLAAVTLVVPSLAPASAAAPAPRSDAVPQSETTPQGYAGPCTDDLGVTVVVDFQGLGGSTVVRCAPGSGGAPFQGTGLAAFQAAGIQITGTSQDGLSIVCRVNGRPAADEPLPISGDEGYTEQCTRMPPASAFWSYWQADNGGGWAFSQLGVKSSTARTGGFEGLSFSLNSTSAPPRTAPSRPTPEPSPAPEPSPPPEPSPTPTPSPIPEPSPTPEPPPPPAEGPAPGTPPSDAPEPVPGEPDPDEPSPGSPPTSDPTAPASGAATSGPTSSATDGPRAAAGEDEAAGATSPRATPSGEAAATSDETIATGAADPSPEAASEQFTDRADDDGGAGALWVTVGILLLLGGLGFLATRRRRDPGITHQEEP